MERLNEERKRRFLMLEEKARLRCLPLVADAKLMLSGHFLVERIKKKDSEMLVKCVCSVASSFMDCGATHFGPLVRQGDLELLVQELKALQGGERWTCLGRRNRRNPRHGWNKTRVFCVV